MMILEQTHLKPAYLGRRLNRFVAEVIWEGQTIQVYCPSTGSLRTCWEEGAPCWIQVDPEPGRKLVGTLVLLTVDSYPIWIHTHRSNDLVHKFFSLFPTQSFRGSDLMRDDWGTIQEIQREVKSDLGSRFDFRLTTTTGSTVWVEVKTVTMEQNHVALFPDAVTQRGQKHLKHLVELVDRDEKAFLFFIISRQTSLSFEPAREIDPKYADLLEESVSKGVNVRCLRIGWQDQKIVLMSYEAWG